jgi:CheY-like chemotaxis protein
MSADDTINILLVEDDDVDIENVKRAFEKGNIINPVYLARDGVEGLEMLRGSVLPRERRLVMLDLNLPRMSGIEMLKEVRDDPALHATVVVVLTTSDDERDRTNAYGLNVAGYLLKPVTFLSFVELMTALNRFWRLVEFP